MISDRISSTDSIRRSQTADLLKGVAVLFMIQVHIMELFATHDLLESAIGAVSLFMGGPPAAPVFMAVMGYFLFRSRLPALSLLRRGMWLIVGGLLLNVGLNANLLTRIHAGEFNLDALQYVFGADILPLAGLSTMSVALIRSVHDKPKLTYPLLALIVALVSSYAADWNFSGDSNVKYVEAFFWGNSSWSYFPLLPWLAYPLMGCAAAAWRTHPVLENVLSSRLRQSVLILISIIVLSGMRYAVEVSTDLPRYYHHGFYFVMWGAAFLVAWSLLIDLLEEQSGGNPILLYIKWIGRNVTAAYVFQWLIIGNIATEIYKSQSLIACAGWFVLILLLTTLLTWGWEKFKPQFKTIIAREASS